MKQNTQTQPKDEMTAVMTQSMKQMEKYDILMKMQPVYIQNSGTILAFKTFFQIANIILIYHFYLSNEAKQPNNSVLANNLLNSLITKNLEITIFIISFLTNFGSVTIILINNALQLNSNKKASSKSRKMNKFLVLAVEMNITISAMLFILNGNFLSFKIGNYFTAISISLFIDGFMQCTSKPLDLIHAYQPLFILQLRIAVCFILSISIITFSYNLSYSALVFACVIFLIAIFCQYLKAGYRTYRNSFSKTCLLIIVTIFLSVCITILSDFYSSNTQTSLNFIFAIKLLSMFIIKRNRSIFRFNQRQFGIEDIDALLYSLSELEEKNQINGKCFLYGLLHHHQYANCTNVYCNIERKVNFSKQIDSKINKKNDQIYEQAAKQFVKCQFNELIKKDSQNFQLLLSYCQFAYYELRNLFPLIRYLNKLQTMHLSLYQRVRLYNLKKNLKFDMQKSDPANNRKIQYEKVICYDSIRQDIAKISFDFIEQNLAAWQQLSHFKVNRQIVLQTVQKMNKTYLMLNAIWKKMEIFTRQWFQLKTHFAFYSLFIEKKLKKDRQVKILEKILRKEEDPNIKNVFPTQEQLFGDNILIVHTYLANNKLFIKKCSKSIQSLLGYTPEEVVLCDIKIIMPTFFQEHHKKKFENWMNQGLVNLDRFEVGVDIFCVDKFQNLKSVTKCFKTFVNENCEIQFVCLLKSQQQKEVSIICNKQLEIQQVSRQFLVLFNNVEPQQYLDKNLQSLLPNINEIMKEFDQLSKQSGDSSSKKISFKGTDIHHFQVQLSRLYYDEQKILVTFNKKIQSRKIIKRLITNLSNQSIPVKEFRKQFEVLSPPLQISNIFTKGTQFFPNRTNNEIKYLKYILHSFLIILLGLFFFMMNDTRQNYNSLSKYIQRHLELLNIAKQPFLLGIQYYLIQNNISIHTDESFIQNTANSFISSVETYSFRETLFGQEFFPGSTQIIDSHISNVSDLTISDIFYTICSSITSLKDDVRGFKGIDYRNFENLLFPLFYKIMQFARNQMYQKYRTFYSNISVPNIFLLELQSVLFVLIMALTTLVFYTFCKKLRKILDIIITMDLNQIKEKIRYWSRLNEMYSQIYPQITINQKSMNFEEGRLSNRLIQSGERYKKYERNLYFRIAISLFIKFFFTAILLVVVFSEVGNLKQFGEKGISYFFYFPQNIVMTYGMLSKYFSNNTSLNTLKYFDQYKDSIQQTALIANFPYMGQPIESNSPFYTTLKNYYFGNICTFNPSVLLSLNITVQQCVSEGQLSQGISSFRKQHQSQIQGFFKGEIELSESRIIFYAKWMNVISYYIEDMIGVWANQYLSRIEDAKYISTCLYSIVSCFVIAIHYFIAQRQFIQKVEDYFEQFTSVYDNLMSQHRIAQNKLIKSKLINLGFIPQ